MGIGFDPNKDYYEKYKRSIEEWVDDDDWINEYAKLVLQDDYVDGDSWGVPGHPTIVLFLVAYIYVLKGKEAPEGEKWDELRWEINRIKNSPDKTIKNE